MGAFYARLARRARDVAAAAAVELALEVVAWRSGVPAAALRRRYPRPAHQGLRQQAIYLAVITGHPRRDIARAVGLSPEIVARHCRVVEERRDDAALDRLLDELELEMMP
jgi:hypothetical protein